MKRIIALLICLLSVLSVSLSLAEQGPDIRCDFIRLPALGEKLETPKEVFTFEGVTFSLYGLEKTDEAILIHAHVKNGTPDTLECTIDKTFYGDSGRMYREMSDIPWSERPAPGAELDVTYSLKYPSGSREVTDAMTGFTFTVLPYTGTAPMCYAAVTVLLGEPLPCELELTTDDDLPYFMYKNGNRAPLFNANGIFISLLTGDAYDGFDFYIRHSGHEKPIRVAFENLVINDEPVESIFEFVLDPETKEATLNLPFVDVKSMTCDFAVYDTETGTQVFEKTPVILTEAANE